jgi:hypothetical protein
MISKNNEIISLDNNSVKRKVGYPTFRNFFSLMQHL